MRITPNEFALPKAATGYPRPEAIGIGLPVLVALTPVLVLWWAGLAIAAGGIALSRRARPKTSEG